ncbi:MAG TPA: folylpolyglutamate synthase/dihydrofolate synthase family protein [Gemmatimonadaceae bacterium]|nr:folylpolyglutamate synthase/dihydrofolate synthase family protein [Gemmatimonadaceae bacterium]
MDDLLTSYGEAIQALFARTTGSIKPGLERTEALLEKLGSPHRKISTIHIAGTNGKGSVVATCEALLGARGLVVGRYTSPHLVDFRERVTVNGKPMFEEEVLEFLERWIPTAEQMGATFFEVTTALAFDWLAKREVDLAVIETGLGGRLDSTNVLMPRVATVTSIGLDHTDLLGDTLEAIAKEKAGIFKSGVPAVIGEPAPAIRDLLAKCAQDAGARPVVVLDQDYAIGDVDVTASGTSFTLGQKASVSGKSSAPSSSSGLWGRKEPQQITTPLIGAHQARNTATAIATLAAVGKEYLPPPAGISKALTGVFLPGRFQRHGKFIFDVAHNPDGARTIAQTLRAVNPPAPRTALVAVLSDKDWRGIIRELTPAVDRFVFTNAPSAPAERKWDAAEALTFAKAQGFAAALEPDMDAALTLAQKDSETVLVTGSFHTVGDAMSRLQVSPFAA